MKEQNLIFTAFWDTISSVCSDHEHLGERS